MTYPTPRTALQGNPPAPGYQPRKQDIVSVLEQMQAIAATQMLKDFHVATGDLPAEGNETGDKRVVLATEAEGGGVYRWDGAAWVLVSALPVLLTESISAQEAAASAALAQEWAEAAADNSRLEMGTVTTAAPGDPADATITGDPGEQKLHLAIPRGADGWAPLLAIVADGDRRVMQIADWAGGEGVPPATGDYLGVSGLVSDIAQAIDIRGPEGAIDGAGDFGADLIATDTAAEARTLLNVAAIALVGLGGQTADIDPDAAGLVTRFVRFTGANAPGGSGSWHGIHISRVLNQQSAQIAVRDTSDSNPSQMAIRHRHSTGDWSPWAFVRTSAELIEAAGLGLSGPGLLGRSGAGAGVAERIEVGAGLELDEGVLKADPQGWEHIVTVPVSGSVAHVDVTDLDGWTDLMVQITDMTATSSSTRRFMRVSSDNGVTFLAGTTYRRSADSGGYPDIHLTDSGSGNRTSTCIILGFGMDWPMKPVIGGRTDSSDATGGIADAGPFDAIRIFASVGDLTGGAVVVYGRK